MSVAEQENDHKMLNSFIDWVEHHKHIRNIMILPYGEALIHPYYQEGIARLARLPHIEGVGIQTNLSFAPQRFMMGFPLFKIRIWASFHPEMTGVDEFVGKIHWLQAHQAGVCVGVVGNPANEDVIRTLRQKLSPTIYLFVNAMQGLTRRLTASEQRFFSSIDNLFLYDLHPPRADYAVCDGGRTTTFFNERGVFACPRSQALWSANKPCERKICDCYIAYSNLKNSRLRQMMGEGAFWRIPEKRAVHAIFFDIDGTLTDANGNIPPAYSHALEHLARTIPLYLATSLPEEYARQTLGTLWGLFRGGVFADGAHIRSGGDDEYIPVLPLPNIAMPASTKVTAYRAPDGSLYKYALTAKSASDVQQLYKTLHSDNYRLFQENCLLTIVDRNADKATGLRRICAQAGIDPAQTLAVGNSAHDAPMLSAAGYSCAVLTAAESLKNHADWTLNPDGLAAFIA
jgi:phosphoserine phosphatase